VPSYLRFPESAAASDASTFARRSALLGDGTIRLQASGGVLVMTCAALAPQSLLEATPTVLGMRMVGVDPELVCDLVVPAASLTLDVTGHALALPETAVSATWAGISPPRSGWTETAGISAASLAQRAQWGIAAVAEALPETPGEEVVRATRARIWGDADDELHGLPRGVAFAAHTLGFIGGEEYARVFTAGPWTRLTLQRGHVLTRSTVRSGLTPVRSTQPRG
jgi:hypothetical protein